MKNFVLASTTVLLVALVALPAQLCAQTFVPPSGTTARPEQANDLRRLLGSAGPLARVHIDSRFGTVRDARGEFSERLGTSEAEARGFVHRFPTLFGLDDPDAELALQSHSVDTMGWHHFAFDRIHRGRTIFGDRLVLHAEPGGRLRAITGRTHPSLGLEAAPQLDEATARFHLERTLTSWAGVTWRPDAARLHWYWSETQPVRLAWQLHPTPIGDDFGAGTLVCQVDAITGERLGCWAEAQDITLQAIQAQGVGTDGEVLAVDGAFAVELGYNVLVDITKPLQQGAAHITYNANGWPTAQLAQIWDSPYQWVAAGDAWFKDPMAVEAHYNMDRIYEYFRTKYQWNSWSGDGAMLVAFVHLDKNLGNAFWSSYAQAMFFGDGDGWTFTPLTHCLDVAGHEFSHAIISATVDLVYQVQSGALNEHIADWWGTAIDQAEGNDGEWLGESCMGPGAQAVGLRNMANPSAGLHPQPGHMADFLTLANDEEHDYGGVHINSGIPNKAAWLMAKQAGFGVVSDLYMTFLAGKYIGPTGQFSDYAAGMMAACAQSAGAGSATCQAVQSALEAVGLPVEGGGTATQCPPNAELGPDGFCYCAQGYVYDVQIDSCIASQCKGVPPTGQCVGSVLQLCSNSAVVQVDCAHFGQVCAFDDQLGVLNCEQKQACDGVPAEGLCDGKVARLCVGGNLVEFDCAQYGQECGLGDGDGKAGCVKAPQTCAPSCAGKNCGADGCGGTCGFCEAGEACGAAGACVATSTAPCGSIGSRGICAGSYLIYCSGINLALLDCAAMGMSCALSGDGVTNDCVASPPAEACGEWTPLGGCEGTELVQCRGGFLTRLPCQLDLGTCGFDSANGEFVCTPGSGECGFLTEEGQCDGELAKWCEGGELMQKFCPAHAAGCAAQEGAGFRCLASACKPSCDTKVCGDDGCGGSCGGCEDGATCVSGVCFTPGGGATGGGATGGGTTPAQPVDGGGGGGGGAACSAAPPQGHSGVGYALLLGLQLAWIGLVRRLTHRTSGDLG